MKNSSHPLKVSLRLLAAKVERNLLTEEEVVGLAKVLRLLADGQSIDQIFGIKKPAHRPKKPDVNQRLFDLELLRIPTKHGGEGLNLEDAVAEISRLHEVSESTVWDNYKSPLGKAIRAEVKKICINPLEQE
jgi:hypothetical protein